MKKMILLTGGTGYIGSHTAVALINDGCDVIIADDLSNSSVDIVNCIKRITGVRPVFYHADVRDDHAVDKIFTIHPIDAVIHFAGMKAVSESVEKPLMYYRNNLDTTLVLLETMKRHRVKQFIFSSSATVYGINNPVPFTEDMLTGRCTNPYGWTKHMIEQILCDASAADPEMSVVLLRYFNPIGAHESGLIGDKPNGIPNNLMPYITQVASGLRDKLSIFGNDYPTHDGTGVRDYIHVLDLAKGHVAAMNYAREHRGIEAVNLGTGKGCSVLDIVKAFKCANDVEIPYIIAPRRAGDIAECYADTSKAKKLFGWHVEKSLEDMCRDSWRFEQNTRESK